MASMLRELLVDLLAPMILPVSSTRIAAFMFQIHRPKHLNFGCTITESLLGCSLRLTSICRVRQHTLLICSPLLVMLLSMLPQLSHLICNFPGCIHHNPVQFPPPIIWVGLTLVLGWHQPPVLKLGPTSSRPRSDISTGQQTSEKLALS
uniref:Uncharacterized protein n=1 Tax=Opuntia streptacantha TaxID=393608 RepID=A0A7C9AAB1_OPUST